VTVPAGVRRRSKGAARERAILDAAAQLIAERGLADVKVSDVAQRAGVSSGHVTYYFPAKSTLLMRAIQQSEEELHRDVDQQLQRIKDPWRRLHRLIELSASSGRRDPGWVLWLEVWANAALDDDLASFQSALDARWRRTLEDVIHYGCHEGAFVTDDPGAVATLLSFLVDGLSVHLTLGDQHIDRALQNSLFLRAAEAHLLHRPGMVVQSGE